MLSHPAFPRSGRGRSQAALYQVKALSERAFLFFRNALQSGGAPRCVPYAPLSPRNFVPLMSSVIISALTAGEQPSVMLFLPHFASPRKLPNSWESQESLRCIPVIIAVWLTLSFS